MLTRSGAIKRNTQRKRKCAICRMPATSAMHLKPFCSPSCGLELANLTIAKQEKVKHKKRKDAIQPLSHWLKLTEEVVNRYVRLRDHADGCISCDKPATWGGQWHASHFRSVGAAKQLRFNLWNIHKACSQCNDKLSGNIAAYTPRIAEKIGAERVEMLNNNHELASYSVEYLARMRKVFAKKSRRLQKRIENAAL